MACKYYVDGKELGETQFKKLLNDGLLDQIIVNQGLQENFSEFEVNEAAISKALGKEVAPLKIRVRRKVNSNKTFNNLKRVKKTKPGEPLQTQEEPVQQNPKKIIKISNDQIDKENKRLKTNRKHNPLIFVTTVAGRLKHNLSKKSKAYKDLYNSQTGIIENLKDGFIYMLVPSANGFTPAKLFTEYLGKTKRATIIRKQINSLFDPRGKENFKEIASNISKLLFKTNISLLEDGTVSLTDSQNLKQPLIFSDAESLNKYILGEYDNNGNVLNNNPGRIAHINWKNLNVNKKVDNKNVDFNEWYSDQGFLKTDLFSEGGNFYHDSSFIMDAYKANDSKNEVLIDVFKAPTLKEEEKNLENAAKEEAVDNSMADVPNSNKKAEEFKNLEPAPGDVGKGLFEKKNKREKYGTSGANTDLKPKLRSTTKLDATTWNKEEEIAWLKEKLGKETVEKYFTFFNSIEDLKEYLPEESYEMLLEARRNGKITHGLFTEAATFIANNAYAGTGFHEAFHVVFNLALSPEQRLSLIKEAIDKYNIPSEATLRDIEEVLADKFMEYVRADEAVKTPSSKIAKFFKSLWRTIKTFFGKQTKISIDTLFEDIQFGEYANKIKFNKTKLPNNIKFRQTNLDPRAEYEGFQYLENALFSKINRIKSQNKSLEKKSDPEVLEEMTKEGGLLRLFGSLFLQMAQDANYLSNELEGNPNKDKIIKQFDDFIDEFDDGNIIDVEIAGEEVPVFKKLSPLALKFSRHLRNRGINLNLTTVEDLKFELNKENSFSDDELNRIIERWQQSYIEINPFETISQILRRELGTIQKQKVVDGVLQPALNSFGSPVYYNVAEIYAFLGENVTDSYSPIEMMDKLKKLKNQKPFIEPIIKLLEDSPTLRTLFYTGLAGKTFQKYLIVQEKNGVYTTYPANRKPLDVLIKQTFISNFLVEENNLFKKYGENDPRKGQRNFQERNFGEVSKQIGILDNIKEEAKEANMLSNEARNKVLDDFSKFLLENHLPISKEKLNKIWNPIENKDNWSNITKLIEATDKLFEQIENNINPFLEFRNSKASGIGTPLENFVNRAKPGFDQALVAAHRNGDNKTVYSIQFSNYLNKLVSKLKTKKGITDYKNNISQDVLLSSMPLIKDLLDKNENLTSIADKLEVALLDSLSVEAKNKNVSYKDLSDIEITAMSVAAYHNNGDGYGYYKLPIPSDSTVLPLIKSKKLSLDEIVDKLTEVAIGERKRIEKFNSIKSKKTSAILNTPNYSDKAEKYNILSFLEGKVTSTTNKEDIKQIIKEHLEGEFLELHKYVYEKSGIITNYKKGVNGEILFADKVITNGTKNKADLFKEYLWNSYYMNTQLTTIFAGDPAFYKNTEDYQKRYKQIVSPGTYTNSELVGEYSGIVLQDETVPTVSDTVDNIIALLKDSNINEQKKKELISYWDSTRKNEKDYHNITDAATFISVDRYIDILNSLGRLTDEHKKAAERIRKGIESPQDAALFSPLKPFLFTKNYIEGIEVPLQIKNSEVLLTKSFAYTKDDNGNFKYPKLIAAYKLLYEGDNPLDFIAFESATKVGGLGTGTTEDGKTKYNNLVLDDNGDYTLETDLILEGAEKNIITLDHADWRLQQETPEHYIDESGNFGSQIRVLAIGDMDMDGDYNIGGKNLKGSEVAKLYQNLIAENLKNSFEEVRSMFLNEKGELDYTLITKELKELALKQNLNEEYFEALELIETIEGKKVPTLPLWHPLLSYKVESLLNSLFKNNVTRQKIKGGQMINATSYGVSDTLKFEMGKDGNYKMQALLPWWSKKFFPKDKDGNINLDSLPKELKNMIGYRIPTEDKYSIFNIEVVGFTPSSAGGQIILPYYATTQAGLDFDIDKLFMMMPEYMIQNGKPVYKKYIDKNSTPSEVADSVLESNELFEDLLNIDKIPKEAFDNILYKKEEVEKEINSLLKTKKELRNNPEFKAIMSNIKQLLDEKKLAKSKESKKVINAAISKEYIKRDELGLEYIDTFENLASRKKEEVKNNLAKVIEKYLDPSDYAQFNNRKTRNNKILEIMIGIMENKHTATSILDPGNFEALKEIGNRIRLAQIPVNANKELLKLKEEAKNANRDTLKELIEELDNNKDFNINYPSTQLTLFNRNMTGNKLIGVIANHVTNHAKAQYTDLQLKTPIEIDGNSYSMLNLQETDGIRISKKLASMLAAVVDNAKDPIADSLNMNMYTVNIVMLLSRLGINENTIFSFINQPSIKKLTKEYFNSTQSLNEIKIKGLINKAVKEHRAKLISLGMSIENINKISKDINLKELNTSLDANENNIDYWVTQYKTLQTFNNFSDISKDLNKIVLASKLDADAVGPTSGENYVMLRNQEKLLREGAKENSLIANYDSFFVNNSDLEINPAFNRWAWLEPVSLLNDHIFPSIGKIDPVNKTIEYSILGGIKNFFSDLKGKYFNLTATEARSIDTAFMTYLGSQLPFFNHKDSKRVLTEVPKNLQDYKNKLEATDPDSVYLDFLNGLFVKDIDNQSSVSRIEYINTGKESLFKERERQVWRQMLNSEEEAARKLALDLVKYSYFSNGFAFGPFSFFNMIPVEFWTDTFAKSNKNKESGLLDAAGNSFTQVLKLGLEDAENSAINDASGYLNKKGIAYNFIKQFVQNNVEKTNIISLLDAKEQREHTPNKGVFTLNEDEVFVFPTTQEGLHNVGEAGFAFAGSVNQNNNFTNYKKGQKGKFTEYLVTGKLTEGKEGLGFGLRAQEAIIENDQIAAINSIKKSKNSTALKQNFKKDFIKLTEVANKKENKNKKFIVSKLEFDTKNIIKEIQDDLGIPDNIILPRNLDPRINKSKKIKANTLYINSGSKDLLREGKWPEFVKVKDKEIKLFELDHNSIPDETVDGKKDVLYKQIPLIKESNYVTSYNYNEDINTEIKDPVKSIKITTTATAEAFKNAINKYEGETKKDSDLRQRLTASKEEVADQKINLEYSYYNNLTKKKGNIPMSKKQWALTLDSLKENKIKELLNC